MKRPNVDDYPLMKDGKLHYYNNDLKKYIDFLENENKQLRICAVSCPKGEQLCDFEHHNADIRRAYNCSECGGRKLK